jgi:hypothetical protein
MTNNTMDEDWVIKIKYKGECKYIALPDGTTIHFSSRQVAQRYFREWRATRGIEKGDIKVYYIKEQ